jgi:hypothetical protein
MKTWSTGVCLAGAACVLSLMLINTLDISKHEDLYQENSRNPAARLSGWAQSSYETRPQLEPQETETNGPARLAGWSPPTRRMRRVKTSKVGLKQSLLLSVDHFRTSDDAAPKWADRALHRFSDYKLKSAMKRLEFSERMSETNLHSIHRAAHESKPLQFNQFYRTNFES